jgi:DNA-binding CsgD family transcriptional regulator
VPDDAATGPGTTVVVGVDGAGRTHRLTQLAAELGVAISRPTPATVEDLLATDDPVVVDDAHRLDATVLTALTGAAEAGRRVVIARRPTLRAPQLAALDDALAARGEVELLPTPDADADDGGLPGWSGDADAVRTRVQRRLALLPPPSAQLVRVLSLDLGLTGDALAAAARLGAADLAPALRATHDAGFTDAAERLVPAVARALRESLTPSEERALLDVAAAAVTGTPGADVVATAERLRSAGARSAAVGAVFRAAGDRLRLTDPAAAVGWYDDAVDAGDDAAAAAAGRAEAAVLLGEPVDATTVTAAGGTGEGDAPAGDEATRLAVALGAAAAADGRPGRAVEHLRAGGDTGAALAAALGWTAGVPAPGTEAAQPRPSRSPWLSRFAEAARTAAQDPHATIPTLIEAAEALETAPPAVLPDTPHAVAAVLAVADADAATGERLLERAIAAGTGGPALRERHRLLLAWVRLRAGRYDTATATVREPGGVLTARDRLVRTALVAGLARRSGDVAAMRDVWPDVQDHLARRAVDLLAVELVEELAVTAARLRMRRNADALLDALEAAAAALGAPAALAVPIAWTRLQVAAVTDDAERAEAAAETLAAAEAAVAASPRHAALCAAGARWAGLLRGDVDEGAVVDVATALAQAQLPWEASRLVGQAGVRTTDPTVARRLLERARDLAGVAGAEQPAEAPAGPAAAGLSEREVEVSRLVLAGRTHREIGAQLYIAPKTVEHHVARIRAKLGATTRAEFVASLRHVLADAADA